jgi:serine/threonine-protein kinase
MAPDKWRQVEELFHKAADLPPARRAGFLDGACGDDDLRREVEALLAADSPDTAALHAAVEHAADLLPAGKEATELRGEHFGRYTITGLIGSGGMGAVYRAIREDDFRMQVAVKLLRRGTDTESALARFRTERQILADLQHPNIARLLDGGATESGLPYLVMEYVDGVPLLEYTGSLPLRRRLELFRSVCGAVHYAHRRHIVHRDIKPANILVTADGVPKLLDFGIAKLLDPAALDTTMALTGVGVRLMTPEYASPEQVRGEPVTAATDVYSLGAVLYELLTGKQAQTIQTYSPAMIEQEICTREPVKPSAVMPELDHDLDNIVLKALRKEPERRYPSAEELSADVGRFLEDLPVQARPESRLYRARKFLRRNRAAATTAVLSATVVLALVTGVGQFAARNDDERSIAVLPLENLSGNREQEYFADGITDALISHLAQIQGVRVISRTSSMTFKGSSRKLPEVARTLRVRTIAEGSVLRSGNRVRLAIRLVDAPQDRPVWSGSYEGELSEVLALQERVAAAIAGEIGVTLKTPGTTGVVRHRRVDVGAYDAYLRGRQEYFGGFTEEANRKAVAWFQKALALDPTYAPAYAGLADCQYMLSNIYYPPTEVMPKARAAVEKALELDETLAEAHATLALINSLYEFRRDEAENGFRRALELKPGDPLIHLWYGLHLAGTRRLDAAITEVEQARKLDPVSPATNAYIGMPLLLARRYDEVIRRMQSLAEEHPEYHHPHAWLGLAYEQKGEWEKAIAAMARAYQADKQPEALAQLGHMYAAAGRTAAARTVLDELMKMSGKRYVAAYNIALMHAGLGERDEAFRWLDKAREDRSEWFAFVGVDPRLDAFRSDPRFAGVLRNAGLAP